jgi:hypothetical protein
MRRTDALPPHRTSGAPAAKLLLAWERVNDKMRQLVGEQPRTAEVLIRGIDMALDALGAKGGA